MTGTTENGLDLAAIRQRFVESEEKLRELAEAAVSLKTGSVQLKRARMGVLDASKVLEETTGTLADFLNELADLSRRLVKITGFFEEADPQAVVRAVGELDERLEAARSHLDGRVAGARAELKDRLAGAQAELSEQLGDTRADLRGRLDEVETSLVAAAGASREAIGSEIDASAARMGEAIDALGTAVGERIQAAAEAERSVVERLERAHAKAIAEQAAARLDGRRLRRLVWLAIALQVLLLGGVGLLLVRGPF